MTTLLHRHPQPAAPKAPPLLPLLPLLPRQSAPAAAAERRRAGRPVLYGCFSCPWCYLASQHSDQLTDPLDGPQWRMVVPNPRLPVTGLRLDAAGRSLLQIQLAAVGAALLPGELLPGEAPAFLPNTGPAVVGYAEACGAGVGDLVRRVLFDAYWQHGADIGNPEVLRRLLVKPILGGHSTSWPLRESGYAVTLAGGPITSQAYQAMLTWQADWHHRAGDVVPAMVSGESTVTGPDAVTALRTLVLAEPGATAGTPAWVTAGDADSSFLSTQGPVFEGTGGRPTAPSAPASANRASPTGK